MPLRLLITGGSGLLGLNWWAARHQTDEVWLGLNTRHISVPNVFKLSDGLDQAIQKIRPDVVIHTAAMTNVDGCEADDEQALSINRDLAKCYAQSAHDYGLPFVHISTDHLFDGRQAMLDETAPCLPINSYGQSKWLGERAVLQAHPDALILRVNFFGWGPSYRSSFSDWILKGLADGSPITLYDNVYFTPLYVGDMIRLAHQLIDKQEKGIYHLTASDRVSKFDFGLKLAAVFDHQTETIIAGAYDPKNGIARPLDMSLDNGKVCRTLGLASLTIDDAIAALHANKSLKKIFSSIGQHSKEK